MKKVILATAVASLLTSILNAKSIELKVGVGQESETQDSLVNIGYSVYLVDSTVRLGIGVNGSFSEQDNPYMDGLLFLGVQQNGMSIEAIAGGTLSSINNNDLSGTTIGGKIGYAINESHKFEAVYLSSTLEDSDQIEYKRKRTSINYIYSF